MDEEADGEQPRRGTQLVSRVAALVLVTPAPESVSPWKGLRNLPPTKVPRMKDPPELGRY